MGLHLSRQHVSDEPGTDPWERPDHDPLYAPEAGSRRGWTAVDLGDVLDGTWAPPQPTVGRRTDGVGLFYAGKSHTVVSETEGGKTWFGESAALDEMRAGHHVVYVDFEDDEGTIAGRLLTLGASAGLIGDHFHYLRPDAPLKGSHIADLEDLLLDVRPTLAIVDGVTEAMALHGLDPLKNQDAALFGAILTTRLTKSGAAVVSLDHVVKDREGRGRYALGAVHKLNGLSGAQYILTNRQPFGVGLTGRSTVHIAKDRPGQLRVNALSSSGGLHWFGDLVLNSHDQDYAEVTIEPPHERSDDFRPTALMAKISDALAGAPQPLSQRVLLGTVRGKDETKRQAFALLVAEGYVSSKTPHTLIKAYEPEDL